MRDGFKASGDVECKGCFDKKIEIEKLREKLKSFQTSQYRRERKAREKPFGEGTPSSKEIKSNSTEDNRKKIGGAKEGHDGHGRKQHATDDLNCVLEEVPAIESCPNCNVPLDEIEVRTRSILEVHPIKAFKKLFSYGRYQCPCCGGRFKPFVPALQKFQFSNRLLANVSVLHYLHGVPMNKICRILGDDVKASAIHNAMDRLSNLCRPAKEMLVEDYRNSKVKHADETGWRTDGHSGYAWYFGSKKTSIFEFRNTRSASVALDILGKNPLSGYLTVDRYGGYNKIGCKIQYCYAHLLRDVKSLKTEFPEETEIQRFVDSFAKQLSLAMKMQQKEISDRKFYKEATKIKSNIIGIVNAPASHLGIRRIQDIFHNKQERLYHWANDRDVSAHNNFAEREIRPIAIARKVSFGSQSAKGAYRRSNIMSVLHSARKRLDKNMDISTWFENKLNEITNGADPICLRIESSN